MGRRRHRTPYQRTKKPGRRAKRTRRHEPKRPADGVVGTPFVLVELGTGWWRRFAVADAPTRGRRIAMEGHRVVGSVPKDVVIARPSLQRYTFFGGPEYVYADQQGTCRDCRERFSFSAREQQHWYEVLRIPLHAQPVRCVGCRRQERARRRAWSELMEAVTAWKGCDSPSTRERVVRATHAARSDVGVRALRRALGWARKLRGLETLAEDLAVAVAAWSLVGPRGDRSNDRGVPS